MATISSTTDNILPNPNIIPSCIPTDTISISAYQYAKIHLHPLILQHSIRVFLLAQSLSTKDLSSLPALQPTTSGVPPDLFNNTRPTTQALFLASIFHDIGTCDDHDHAQRFEVCGADAAVSFLGSLDHRSNGGHSNSDLREIWTAIALHTSPGLAERMSPLTRLLRIAVKADFGAVQYRSLLDAAKIERFEAQFPRGEVEKVLGDCVAIQAERRAESDRVIKAPQVSWPWNLLRARLEHPGWTGVNKGF